MPYKADISDLSIFQQKLIGTWTNQNLPNTNNGGPANPYSYNVMPLPQLSPQNGMDLGYILKDFTYYEMIVFKGENDLVYPVAAPNRGGTFQQTPRALFYEQRICIAEGNDKDQVVHEENGAWLYLQTQKQQIGPYPYPTNDPALEPGDPVSQPLDQTICKQISVPHGDSILALGAFLEFPYAPLITDAPPTLPTPEGLDTTPYGEVLDEQDNYQNPQPDPAQQSNLPLKNAINDLLNAQNFVSNHIYCRVDSTNGGTVVNIPFEQRQAAATGYSAEYWLLSCDGGLDYDILAYRQLVTLDILVNGQHYSFPHPTCNVLTRLKT